MVKGERLRVNSYYRIVRIRAQSTAGDNSPLIGRTFRCEDRPTNNLGYYKDTTGSWLNPEPLVDGGYFLLCSNGVISVDLELSTESDFTVEHVIYD